MKAIPTSDTAVAGSVRTMQGLRVLVLPGDGAAIAREGDALDLMSMAWDAEAEMVAIPVQRLAPAFFRLSTRLAGDLIQKFVNYGVRLAIVGDIPQEALASAALRDFLREADRGDAVWFVGTLDELDARLAPAG